MYLRVSTGKQARLGWSLESQERLLSQAAETDGYIFETYADTASGRDARRPELNRALEKLRDGEASALYSLDIDRLARSTLHLLEIARSSQREGWRLVITSANVDTSTPAGEMFFTLAAAFAQYESRMISERVLRQHEARRERGEVWGLSTGPTSQQADYVLQRIATEIEAGKGFNWIANRFNIEKVPTARGGRWHAATIRGIWHSLRMAQYLGTKSEVGHSRVSS